MKLIVSSSPHWHDGSSIKKIYYNIIIALLPVVAFAIYSFGMHAVRVIALSCASAMLSEVLIRKLFKKDFETDNGFALLTGLLFALILPASMPYWIVIFGAFLCIFTGKEVFGGLGSNPIAPVLVGWAILRISWPEYFNLNFVLAPYDLAYDWQYPLALVKSSGTDSIATYTMMDLFMGKQAGGLGSTNGLLLLIGGAYLIIRKIISWEISLFFLIGTLIMATIYNVMNPSLYANGLFHILTGNLLIGLFFLSTDYGSSPYSKWGLIIFGLGCGMLTVILRAWSSYPDGVVFAIMIMSLFTPLLDKIAPKIKKINVNYLERNKVL
ncbi:MAG: RnfABCDGE type electron transport complex subunit D [Pseudomonadota bacterium]